MSYIRSILIEFYRFKNNNDFGKALILALKQIIQVEISAQ